jgi:hypothetical protein
MESGEVMCSTTESAVEWNNIKKRVPYIYDLIGKAHRRAREPRTTQKMINKMNKRKEMEECIQRRRKEELQKNTEERTEKSHRQGQEGES